MALTSVADIACEATRGPRMVVRFLGARQRLDSLHHAVHQDVAMVSPTSDIVGIAISPPVVTTARAISNAAGAPTKSTM